MSFMIYRKINIKQGLSGNQAAPLCSRLGVCY